MMPKPKKDRFITELEIVANSKVRKELKSRYNAGFRLYNTVLGELLIRMNQVRNSKEWAEVKKIPATVLDKKSGKRISNPERGKAFQSVKDLYRFTKSDSEQYAKLTAERSVWMRQKLDSVVIQTLAERAFKSVDKILFGKAKKVRFKNNASFSSMEGKQISTSIRVLQDKKSGEHSFVWGKLVCPVLIDWTDPCIKHGMESEWKYGRIVRRTIRGELRYFVQLVCEGKPYSGRENTKVKDAQSSVDLNVSAVAMVSENKAFLEPFAPQAPKIDKQIKSLQRKQERSRRANNPDNYQPDSTVQKGKKQGRTVKRKGQIKRGKKLKWNNSSSYHIFGEQRRKLERSKTKYVQSENRKLANKVLREGGKHLNLENVSVKGWQKRWGKAIGVKSPGFFQSELVRKAESAGGTVQKFATQSTALSQTHLNGERIKKSLSERVHKDVTGIVMHRDLFSAYLGLYVNQDGLLMVESARADYARIEPILVAAWQAYIQQSRPETQKRKARSLISPLETVCTEGQNPNQTTVNAVKVRGEWTGLQTALRLT